MSWGKWIIICFILFTVFIATLVTVCMRQDVSLVSKDYYQEELAYQDQLARVNNANRLSERPVIQKNGDFLEVNFSNFNVVRNAELKLFRPSDAAMDKIFTLETTTKTTQSFSIADLEKGMYRARMLWKMNDKEYFIETIINI
jgi:hypothetical protein